MAKANQVDGKPHAGTRLSKITADVLIFTRKYGKPSGLAFVGVGNNQQFERYLTILRNVSAEVGVHFIHLELPKHVSEAQCVAKVREINRDPNVQGISVQLSFAKTHRRTKSFNRNIY